MFTGLIEAVGEVLDGRRVMAQTLFTPALASDVSPAEHGAVESLRAMEARLARPVALALVVALGSFVMAAASLIALVIR